MARLRTLVAAGWVMVLTIAGSAVIEPAATAPAATAQDAGSIDATGASDATADLQALFDRTPDGGVVQLQAGADYRLEGTLVLEERHNLRIEGNGARIFATPVAVRSHSQLRIVGGSDVAVRNLEIEGANPHAGRERGYVAAFEAQHGISLEGVTDVELDRVHIHDTYGDHVYVSRHEEDRRWSERVWIHDSTFERTGRQGIAVVAARDVVIERNTMTDMARATIDLEPTTASWGADNVHIIDNEIGPGRLLFVAAGGGGPVNRVVIARNTLRGRDLSFRVVPPEGQRRQRFWVVDNTSDTPISEPPVEFTRVDGAIVHGNRQPISGPEALVKVHDSCDVAVTNNNTAPGTLALEGRSRQCNFILPVEPPEPPLVAGRGQPPVTAPPTTAPPPPPSTAPATTTTTTPPTSARGSTTDAGPPGTQLAASETRGGDGVAGPVVVLAMVLSAVAGAGGALVLSAWRARR